MRGRKRFMTVGFLLLMILALGGCDLATPQPVLKPDATLEALVKSEPTEVFDVSMLATTAQLAVEVQVTAGGVTPLGATIVLGPPKANSALTDLSVRALAGDRVLAEYVMADPRLAEVDDTGTVVLEAAQTFVYAPLSPDLTVLEITAVEGRVGVSTGGTTDLKPLIWQACNEQPDIKACQEILRKQAQIRVFLGGPPFDISDVQQAVLSGVAWERAIAEAFAGEDVAVVVSLWPKGPVSWDARTTPFDLNRAVELLAKGGFRDGFSLWLVYPREDKELSLLAESMLANLSRMAIGVETVPVDPANAQAIVERAIAGGRPLIWLTR